MSLDTILRKVRALRDLAARSTSLAEAQTAAAQADAILQKHRLCEADVEASTGAAHESICEDETPLWSGGARIDKVAARLAAVLGEHYGCAVYSNRSYRLGATIAVDLRVAGRPGDVEIVRYMFAWLRVEIDRLAKGRAERNSFRQGAVTGISLVLARSAKAAQAEHTAMGGTARAGMVVASRHEAAKQWLSTAHGKMGKAREASGANLDREAFADGVRAGASLHIGAALPPGRRALGTGSES